MAPWAKWVVAGPTVAAAGIAVATWIGSLRQAHATDEFIQQLSQPAKANCAVDFAELDSLPEPVARYFRRALKDGQPCVQRARYRQRGQLRLGAERRRWMAFEAEQLVVPPTHGFLWNARVAALPLLHVRVLEGYVNGVGSGRVSLLSAFAIGQQQRADEMNAGALHHYLADAVWYPTALLPGAGVQWSAIDDRRALATLTDGGTTVSLEFRFSESGDVSGVFTPGRWGRVDGVFRRAPWEGHFSRYEERAGMRVPLESEAGWFVQDQWHAVWQGRMQDVAYVL